ncbi:hypothetical protein TSUD_259390 [Trifolium subterraneum]|uniref:D-isomer specific 2-hydroxyacid dehydrogenase catalytic domain-containing protein n=1 Tax=Trifolium subterraneum TaxID=3900 RepID=A0A2Z6MLI1_TRISU|nr:hypothetical protein TSUD_259390 [Trifolium subterraneum]
MRRESVRLLVRSSKSLLFGRNSKQSLVYSTTATQDPRKNLMEKNGNMTKDVERKITRVLFCGHQFPGSHLYTTEYLQNHSFIKVDVIPLEEVPKAIANYHVCIVKMMKLDSNLISRAAQMQLIMQYGVGLEGVDIDAATKHGIKVARIPGDVTGNAASCAEMAIYLMLGLLRKQV